MTSSDIAERVVMKKGREDLPPWACLVGFLPASVGFVLGLGFAISFLIYVGVTTAMIIVWLLDNILQELRSQRSHATRFSNHRD